MPRTRRQSPPVRRPRGASGGLQERRSWAKGKYRPADAEHALEHVARKGAPTCSSLTLLLH
eukprot:376847-Prymnesium_polylepis.1